MSIASQLGRSLTASWLNLLLVVAPISWWLAAGDGASLWLFVAAAVALIPAAGLIGEATEELANRCGATLGGLMNATFGNAAELIIAIVALRANHVEVVKASITGSIIGNLLLVFGASSFVGGLTHGTQRFNRVASSSATVMLSLAVAALVMPATVDFFAFGSLKARPEVLLRLSVWTAWVLLVVYVAGLVFAFRTNTDPLRPAGHHPSRLSTASAVILLLLGTLLTTVEAEILVRGLEPALAQLGMTELFAGIIVVALVGNAAEHYSAVSAARRNDMTLAIQISIGSSAQIALMVAPLLVIVSQMMHVPMSLVFNPFEIAAIVLSVGTVTLVAMDGESNWLEGLQLLGLYVILAAAFYLIPG
ncbi:MAG TPA: calcium/proton exchanger [Vicinamibacterales bacterium]